MQDKKIMKYGNGNRKNAVVVVAIGKSKMWNISQKTIKKYCKKYRLALEIITEKKYDTERAQDNYHYINFEKNQVFELFDKYDRILRLDWDVIVSPRCSNLFEIVPEDSIGVVFEDVGSRKDDRLNRIRMIQEQLGNLGWNSGYFNSGIILASKQHREIFYTTMEDVEIVINLKTRFSKEQNYLNFKVRKLGFKIHELSYKFNHTRIFSEPWNGSPEMYKSYIIHYAGQKKEGLRNMKIDYGLLFLKKPKPYNLKEDLSRKFPLFFYSLRDVRKIFRAKDLSLSQKLRNILYISKKRLIDAYFKKKAFIS